MPGTWFLSVVATISTSSKKQSRGLLLDRDGVTCGGRLSCVETSTKRRRIIRHALLLSLLLRWDGIITLQSICAHVVDLAHLKQHIGLLHVICGAARIRTTARSGRSNDHGKHPRGQCGAQPHIVTKAGLPGKRKEDGTKSMWATGIEPKFAGTRNLLRNKQREQVQASPAFTIQAISVISLDQDCLSSL